MAGCRQVDLDKSGGITFDEFVMMMRLGGMKTDFEKEMKEAFAFFDKNKDGVVRSPGHAAAAGRA